jgi:hypothetical protein
MTNQQVHNQAGLAILDAASFGQFFLENITLIAIQVTKCLIR